MAPNTGTLPTLAWIYGVAGLIPFVGCAAADIAAITPGPAWWRFALLIYSAIILSFLGGGRWGLELAQAVPRRSVITLAMGPSIAGFFLLLTPGADRTWALCGAIVAHGLQWLWDVRGSGRPEGYGRLRTVLAGGAMLSIVAALAVG